MHRVVQELNGRWGEDVIESGSVDLKAPIVAVRREHGQGGMGR